MRPRVTSVFDPGSPQAQAIADLFHFDLAIAAVIFLAVAGLVTYAALRFRWRPGAREPYQNHGNLKMEILWTVVPALILTVLLVRTAYTMSFVNPLAGSKTPDAVVIAHQWWWEYHYPQSGIVTANELHMPEGQKWLLQVESADVIHDFWVPDLGAKVDAIPAHPDYLWFQPQRDGVYLGTCAEYCGAQHALMGIRVIVDSPARFSQWEQSQIRVPTQPASPVARQGGRYFQDLTCTNCHRIAGTEAQAQVGPDLTHLADRQTIGAGVLDNTPDNLAKWLENPQQFKPECYMPNLHLTTEQARAIATYLEALK
jgi:cytochrome c oxidase subunit II